MIELCVFSQSRKGAVVKKLILFFFMFFGAFVAANAEYTNNGEFLDGKADVVFNGSVYYQGSPSSYWLGDEYGDFNVEINPADYPASFGGVGGQKNFDIIFNISFAGLTQPSFVTLGFSYALMGQWGQYPWEYFINYEQPLFAYIEPSISACVGSGEGGAILHGGFGGQSCSFVANQSTNVQLALKISDYQMGLWFYGANPNFPEIDPGKLTINVYAHTTPVPEPQTYGLMFAGLAVLLAQRGVRRRIAAGTILALGIASTAAHAETTQPSGAASSLMTLSYSVEDLDYSDGVVASASPYSDYTAFSTTGSPTTVLRSLTHDGTGYFWKYVSPTYTDEFFVPKEDADDTYSPNFFFTPAIEQFIVAPNTHISVSINIEQSLNYNCTPCMGATYYVADFEGIYQVTDYWGTYVIGERLQSFGTSALKGLWEPGTSLSKSYTLYYYNFDTSPVLVSLYVGSSALLYVPSTATVTSVPEPQTYALMLAGLAVIGVTMKRRRTGS